MPVKTIIAIISAAIIVILLAGCIDLDWDGVEYDAQATHEASGPAEERAYATATAEAKGNER